MTCHLQSSNQGYRNDDIWDVFDDPLELLDADSDRGNDKWKRVQRVTKFLICIITFFVVLIGCVISKSSLLFVTAHLNRGPKLYCHEDVSNEERNEFIITLSEREIVTWMWILVFIYFIPQLATFLRSTRILLFKKWKMPGLFEFMSVFFGESLSSIGNAILVFYVLPRMDFIRGCLIMNCLCLIPTALSFWSKYTEKQVTSKLIYLNFSCVVIQILGLTLLTVFHDGEDVWYLPLSITFISLGWWENYVRHKMIYKIKAFNDVMISSKTFPNNRYFTYSFVSLWKCILFFGMMCFIEWRLQGKVDHVFLFFQNAFDDYNIAIQNINQNVTNTTSNITLTNNLTPIWTLILNVATTYLTYIFGKFACKINIQRISYAIPLHLSGIITTVQFLILSLKYNNNINCNSLNAFPSNLLLNNPNIFEIEDIWLIFMALFLFGSYIFTTHHVFVPQNKVLASSEELYVRPYYEPFLIDQDLVMNRRRYDEFVENISNDKENMVPKLYVCGTMWHETKDEMLTFLKSIVILDEHHCLTRIRNYYNKTINYYQLESHIVFDDSFTKISQRNQKPQMNDFVKELINNVDEVVSSVYNNDIKLKNPIKYDTPYGGKLEWILPGKTKLVVHLKDNNKVRSRKRWSQVMYMYYILGHRIIERTDLNNDQKELEAKNTYILSVDGDIHFRPKAVEMLLDQMKRDKMLGAACGRVHPVGKGIFAWYQKFEYAISYWLYKASENITGCVLCCPGCFTIYRGSAILSILKKLKIKSTKAVHFMKFDHGEDRWISVLLALCGFKVGYVASADAHTNCPESFGELYNQRRRWIPSTTANMLDLLSRTKLVTKINENVSCLFMVYQYIFNIITLLTPSLVFWIMVNMCKQLFNISLSLSLVINLIIILMYIAVCAYLKNEKVQIQLATILCGIYSPLMCAYFINGVIELLSIGFTTSWTLFFFFFLLQMLVIALCHPQEIYYLKYLPIYYIMIPTMLLILYIYSVFNMHKVSWGTREVLKEAISEDVSEKSWIDDHDLKCGNLGNLSDEENSFWVQILKKYLYPLDNTKDKDRILDDLKNLQGNVITTLFIVYSMFISVVFLLTSQNITVPWPFKFITNGEDYELELINTILIVLTLLLFTVQIIALFIHRFGSFAQIMGNTKLMPHKDNTQKDPVKLMRKFLQKHNNSCVRKSNGQINCNNSVYTDLEDAINSNNNNMNYNGIYCGNDNVNYGFLENV